VWSIDRVGIDKVEIQDGTVNEGRGLARSVRVSTTPLAIVVTTWRRGGVEVERGDLEF
jgi:hypothetical protein